MCGPMTNLLNSLSFAVAAHGGPMAAHGGKDYCSTGRVHTSSDLTLDIGHPGKQTLRQLLPEVSPMKSRFTIAAAILNLLAVAVPAFAHHSFAAEFDAAQRISLTGVVTKVEWTNPHVWFWPPVTAFHVAVPTLVGTVLPAVLPMPRLPKRL